MGFLTKMLISLRNTENWFSVDMLSFGYQIIFKTFTDNMRQSCLKLLPSTNTDNHDKYHGFDMNILPETLEVNQQPSCHHQPNEFSFNFGSVLLSNWYLKFLHPSVHQKTSIIPARIDTLTLELFCALLIKIDKITDMFIDMGWCRLSMHKIDATLFYIKTQIKTMAWLNILVNHTPVC